MNGKTFLVVIMMSLFAFTANCQQQWKYISKENISFKLPEDWKMTNSSKPKGAVTITLENPANQQFVEIKCERAKINLKVRANDIATSRSQRPTFEYMQIDKINSVKFNNHDAQLLNYTNTFENEVYKGGVYSFVKEGYTYTIEFYGEDNPQSQAFLQQIVNTVNVNSADKKENIKDQAEEYVPQNWATEEIDRSAEIAEKEAALAAEKAAKEAAKAKEKEMKAQQKAQKEVEKQQKKLEQKQQEIEKQQKKLEKKQAEAEKAKAKAEKKAQEAEKKRIVKENKIKELQSRQKSIDKELNKIAEQQMKLGEDYGVAQLKNDGKKMEKIQKQQTKLADKVIKLNKERDGIIKKLSKF